MALNSRSLIYTGRKKVPEDWLKGTAKVRRSKTIRPLVEQARLHSQFALEPFQSSALHCMAETAEFEASEAE